jgi:predicted NodU family carbamoyl transferase
LALSLTAALAVLPARLLLPHSLGIFYQAITQSLGFPYYGDEYKVMGLAPYGRPPFLDSMRKIVLTISGMQAMLQYGRNPL